MPLEWRLDTLWEWKSPSRPERRASTHSIPMSSQLVDSFYLPASGLHPELEPWQPPESILERRLEMIPRPYWVLNGRRPVGWQLRPPLDSKAWQHSVRRTKEARPSCPAGQKLPLPVTRLWRAWAPGGEAFQAILPARSHPPKLECRWYPGRWAWGCRRPEEQLQRRVIRRWETPSLAGGWRCWDAGPKAAPEKQWRCRPGTRERWMEIESADQRQAGSARPLPDSSGCRPVRCQSPACVPGN